MGCPDIALVKRKHLREDLDRFPTMAPDLAVEIISPEDNFNAIMDKADDYLQQGSDIVWLVAPKKREVLVCTKEGKHGVHDVITAPELLPGFELQLEKASQTFRRLRAPDFSNRFIAACPLVNRDYLAGLKAHSDLFV